MQKLNFYTTVIAASLLSVHWLEDLARFEVTVRVLSPFQFQMLTANEQWAAWGSMSMAIVTDVTIAVVLAFTLVKSSPNLSWTNSSSVMLCAYVLNSGALPAYVLPSCLIFFLWQLMKMLYIGFCRFWFSFRSLKVLLLQCSLLLKVSYPNVSIITLYLTNANVHTVVHINVLLAMLNARSYLQSARQLNPAIFYIPTSDNSGVIFQPPPGHHRHHSSFAYGNEYHVRSFGNGGDVEDNGETINELGLPLFKLPSYKVGGGGEEGRKRKDRKPGTPNSTATTVAPTGAREGEKDEVDRMFDDLGLQRHRTTPSATPYASPTNSNSAQEPAPLPVNIPLEVRVQTTKQATYTSYSRPSSNGRGRWLGR